LTKNGLGYILGDSFTNSSGRPEKVKRCLEEVRRRTWVRRRPNESKYLSTFLSSLSKLAKKYRHGRFVFLALDSLARDILLGGAAVAQRKSGRGNKQKPEGSRQGDQKLAKFGSLAMEDVAL
jgi:hypothetical protein